MFFLYCLILGAIQGLTEFLPVSSSGHLALFEAFFPDAPALPGGATAFGVLLHLGTLAAVFIACRRDLLTLPSAFFSLAGRLFSKKRRSAEMTKDEKLCLLLIFGTLPLVAFKALDLLLEKTLGFSAVLILETYISPRPIVIGAILLLNGAMLCGADRLRKKGKTLQDLRPADALCVGVFQTFALLPGLSRSGATIAAGLLVGLDRRDALRFSFLLSVPAVLGATVVEAPALFGGGVGIYALLVSFAAALAAFAVGLCSLRLLRQMAQSASFLPFSFYCWALGALAAVAGAIRLAA